MNADRLTVFTKAYDFTPWLMNHTAKFPRAARFSVAAKLEKRLLDFLGAMLGAWMKQQAAAEPRRPGAWRRARPRGRKRFVRGSRNVRKYRAAVWRGGRGEGGAMGSISREWVGRLAAAALAAAAAGAAPAAAFDDIQFPAGFSVDGMQRPAAVSAAMGRYFITDLKRGALYIYESDGRFARSVGRTGSEKGNFSGPKGLHAAAGDLGSFADGRVYVADTGNSRVQILDGDGNFAGMFGTKGSERGQLRYPESVFYGPDGRVYVADTGNDRVQVFTREGVFLFGLGASGKGPGEFKGPTRVAVDAADFIYVLDSGNERIQKFDGRLSFVRQFNALGSDFALDPYGFMYVLDGDAGKVRELTPEGAESGKYGSRGKGARQFKEPVSVALAPDGAVIVLDPGNRRVSLASLTNKLKVSPVAASLSPKLLVSGPQAVWSYSASAMATLGEDLLYLYLPEEGRFAVVGRDGKASRRFGARGKDPAATKGSRGFAVDAAHGLFVADTDGNKIQRFDADGRFLGAFAQKTGIFQSRSGEGLVKSPQGVAVTEKGMVYVADTGNRRVDVFGKDGTFLTAIGPAVGSEELDEPVAVAWDKAGYLYIVDKGLKKVFKCEPSGGFVASWGGEGPGPGKFMEPVSIAYDGFAYVYVLDQAGRRVSVFDRDGAWVTDFFAGGDDERSLSEPSAVAVQGNRLIVSDPGKGRVVSFALHPRLAPPASVSTAAVEGTVTLKWKPSPDAWAWRYRVLRSSAAEGPYEPVAEVQGASYEDKAVSPYRDYYYRLASVARTSDTGPASQPVKVSVAGAFNRPPIEITSIELGDIFSANYKYYERNSVGRLVLTNNVNLPFQKVKVGFRLKEFMDFATERELAELAPQAKVEVPLMPVLNNRILEVTEDTPIQAEFSLTYFEAGRQQTVSITKPLRVYSRNSIVWDKPERIVTYITSNDTPIADFKAWAMNPQNAPLPMGTQFFREEVVAGMKVWAALGALGVRFQRAANNPFEEVSRNPAFPVDYTQFPRETLKRKSGECDDLATLLSSILEAAGVQTALLDYPGHIALMLNTGTADPAAAGLPEDSFIKYRGTLWLPIEPTLVGSDFTSAYRQALNAWSQMSAEGKASIIDPRVAVSTFAPATMPTTSWEAEPPKPGEMAKRFNSDVEVFAKARAAFLGERYRAALAKDPKNAEAMVQLGILAAEAGDRAGASEEFGRVLAADPDEPAALNNQGSLAFLAGDYAGAEDFFQKAAERDPADAGIWLNLAKTAAKRGDPDRVREFGQRALGLDGGLKTAVEMLGVK